MVLGDLRKTRLRDRASVRDYNSLDWHDQTRTRDVFKEPEVSELLCIILHADAENIDLSYSDPFYHSVEYSPSDPDTVHRATKGAQRQLLPHNLLLQLLFSRLQAARYRKAEIMLLLQRIALASARAHTHMRYGVLNKIHNITKITDMQHSTHPLAREARFSLLLFGFEVLRSSHLDAYCENQLRDSLYRAAFAWFAVRPQYGISNLLGISSFSG